MGNAHDESVRSGVTVLVSNGDLIAAVDSRGGGTGSREFDLLRPEASVQGVNAIVLSGGSAFGLDAAGGVMTALREAGIGYRVGSAIVPIVPAAILFDLNNGGDKNWGADSPYPALGRKATVAASDRFELGNAGAGFGAQAGIYKGGLGSASVQSAETGATVGALVAVNAVGAVTYPVSKAFLPGHPKWRANLAASCRSQRTEGAPLICLNSLHRGRTPQLALWRPTPL